MYIAVVYSRCTHYALYTCRSVALSASFEHQNESAVLSVINQVRRLIQYAVIRSALVTAICCHTTAIYNGYMLSSGAP
jgi:hypothetical protein